MAVNFGLLQPAQPVSAFFQGQQDVQREAEQNMLRQMQAEKQQFERENMLAQRQRQQFEFEQAQQDRRRQLEQEDQFGKMADLIRQNGLDPDDPKVLSQFAEAAMVSRQPQLASFVTSMAERAAKRRAAATEARQIGDILGPPRLPPGPPLQPGAQQNALAGPAPMTNALAAPQPDLLAGTPYSIGPVAPPAPPQAPAAAAPSDNAAKIAQLENQRDALEALGTPAALTQAKRLDRQLEKLAPPKPETFAPPELVRLQDRLAELPEGDPRRPAIEQRISVLTTKPEGTKVTVPVNAYVPASQEAQKEFMSETRKQFNALGNAPDTLKNIDAAKKLIPTASGFMGKGGEPLLAAASFLNNRLGFNIATQGVTDATVLRTRLFEGILDNLKKLDSQPSQEQQRVLAEALGNLGTDPQALVQILDRIGETVQDRVARYNETVTEAETRGVKFPYKPQIKLPERARPAPAIPSAPPGAAPAAARTIVRTGTLNGKRVVQYSDGSTEYAAD